MLNSPKKKKLRLAQSATELAIFGAIVIFIIGLIVKAALQSSSMMNQSLKTMRLALIESFRTGEGKYNYGTITYQTSAARNTASVLVLEDRLSADASQPTGTRDRIPFVASASASFTKAMFYPVECPNENGICEHWNLPVQDIFINGQRFPFTLSAFRRYNYPSGTGNAAVSWQDTWSGGTRVVNLQECSPYYAAVPALESIAPHGTCYKSQCMFLPGVGIVGCTIFFARLANQSQPYDFKAGEVNRFDLDFSGGAPDVATAAARSKFAWQWMPVAGVNHDKFKKYKNVFFDDSFYKGIRGILPDEQINTLIDVDGDLREESIVDWSTDQYGVVTKLRVMDSQEGDLNNAEDDMDLKIFLLRNPAQTYIKIGLLPDMTMYSFTGLEGDGSALTNAYELENSQTRHTLIQENLDIIERIFKITNDTGRFCRNGVPVNWEEADETIIYGAGGLPFATIHGVFGMTNPVEVCGNCYEGSNVELTCLDLETMLLVVRSRVHDQRGHQWITRVPGSNL